MNKFLATALAASALLLLLFVIQPSISGKVVANGEKLVLSANTLTLIAAPIFVAEEKNFFGEQGLIVEVVPFTTGRAAFEAMLAGKSDASFNAEFPPLNALLKGQESCLLKEIANEPGEIVSRKEVGSITKLGVPKGTTGEYFAHLILGKKNLIPEIIDLKPPYLSLALEKGEVDAIAWFPPETYYAKALLKGNYISLNSTGVYEEHFGIWTKKENNISKAESLTKLLLAFNKASEFILENPLESQKIVSKKMGIKLGDLQEIWPDLSFQVKNDGSLLSDLKKEAKWVLNESTEYNYEGLKELVCQQI